VARLNEEHEAARGKKKTESPVKDGDDKDQDEFHGKWIVRFKSQFKPQCIDAKKVELEKGVEVRSGDVIKVGFAINPYDKGKNAGISLQLRAVQLLEKRAGQGGDYKDAFGEEEGYEGESRKTISRTTVKAAKKATSNPVVIGTAIRSARAWLGKWGTVASVIAFLGLAPVPASRPRVSKWGTYYAKNYAGWLKAAAKALEGEPSCPTDAPLVVFVEQIVEKARTSSLTYPRGDIDNFVKGPLDAITKSEKLWVDDNQVVGLIAFKRFAENGEAPGTSVEFVKLEG
jgi:Holliday junction resolvase RusA-like endonuclease